MEKTRVLSMKNIHSLEHYEGKPPLPVLSDVNLAINAGETWGIYAETAFETKLLLQIIGGVRPFVGQYQLFGKTINPKKPNNPPKLFYIGTPRMPYPNMNVLEYLMFTTEKTDFQFQDIDPVDYLDYSTAKDELKRVYRQEELLEQLISLGLDYLALSPLKHLYDDERAVVALIAASYSENPVIVFNFPEYEFPDFLACSIPKIVERATLNGKTTLLGLCDPDLIEETASHSLYLVDGLMLYSGSIDKLRFVHDKIVAYVCDEHIDKIYATLTPLLLDYELWIDDNALIIRDKNNKKEFPSRVYQTIVSAGLSPDAIEINEKTVRNAYQELLRQHDL